MELKNKVVLVTGSSQGIGKETVIAFSEKGAKVIITYNKNKKMGEKVLKECGKQSEGILIHLDVKNEKSIENAFEKIKKEFGKLDVIVNNAGVINWGDFSKQNKEGIDNQIETNLTGLIKTTKVFLPLLSKQNEALIINISSAAGKQAYGDLIVYCATKFGVRGFTQALAQELPEKIKIYSVNPGLTATQMTKFQGVNPRKVADLIIKATEGKINVDSSRDIDVWKFF